MRKQLKTWLCQSLIELCLASWQTSNLRNLTQRLWKVPNGTEWYPMVPNGAQWYHATNWYPMGEVEVFSKITELDILVFPQSYTPLSKVCTNVPI